MGDRQIGVSVSVRVDRPKRPADVRSKQIVALDLIADVDHSTAIGPPDPHRLGVGRRGIADRIIIDMPVGEQQLPNTVGVQIGRDGAEPDQHLGGTPAAGGIGPVGPKTGPALQV